VSDGQDLLHFIVALAFDEVSALALRVVVVLQFRNVHEYLPVHHQAFALLYLVGDGLEVFGCTQYYSAWFDDIKHRHSKLLQAQLLKLWPKLGSFTQPIRVSK